MFRLAFAAACLIVSAVAAKDPPKLEFSKDGTDLVVKATLTVNNSPHVVWTDAQVGRDWVTLHYHVFQCPDLYNRSRKDVELVWRIPNGKQEAVKSELVNEFRPTTAQLKALLPQLEKLAAEGKKD